VLSTKSFGEADKIIIVLTPIGKKSFIAKGVRRPSSRKRGHLTQFNKIKFSAAKGKGMDVLTEVELVNSYTELKNDIKKTLVAYYLVEVVSKLTYEEEPHSPVYELLDAYLVNLQTSNKTKKLKNDFIMDILVELGFWTADKPMPNPDYILETVTEKNIHSSRVGKKVLE
jgi:DNA repair protein RecO (recombination protein O)